MVNNLFCEYRCDASLALLGGWFLRDQNYQQRQTQSLLLTACTRYHDFLGVSLWSVCELTVKTKRWNLGIKTNPSLAFGISPSSYFTDGKDNAEENDMWKQEHKHCFVWQRKPGPFKVNVYLVILIDNSFIFQPVFYASILFQVDFSYLTIWNN